MRQPPTRLEIVTVLATLALVVWTVSHSANRPDPETAAAVDTAQDGSAGASNSDSRKPPAIVDPAEGNKVGSPPGRSVWPSSSGLAVPSFLDEVLSGADPETAALLQHGFALMQAGNFDEARRVFETILKDIPDAGLRPPAMWALAHSYYLEGGPENMALSAGRFADFLVRYEKYKPEILVEAAQIDLAIICMDLMNSGVTDRERMEAAGVAAKALQAFIDQWPDHPQSQAARDSLLRVQSLLANRR